MCVHKKFYYKLTFWTCLAALLVVTILATIGIFQTLKLKQTFDRYDEIFKETHSLMIIMMIICCVLITLASVLSLIGVLMDWFPLLIISSYGLVIASLFSMIVGFWILAISREAILDHGMAVGIVTELEELVKKPDFLALNNTILDPIQLDFECCGVNGFEDYAESTTRKWMRDILPLPKSCCINPEKNCLPNSDEHKKHGCLTKFTLYVTEVFNNYAVLLITFGIATGINGMYMFLISRKAKELYLYYPYYF